MSDIPPPLDPHKIPTSSGTQRFVIAFMLGGLSFGLGTGRDGGSFVGALVVGCAAGLFFGIVAAIFGQRVFDFLVRCIFPYP